MTHLSTGYVEGTGEFNISVCRESILAVGENWSFVVRWAT